MFEAYTKLLWWLGVVAAFLLILFGMAATLVGDDFGGDPGAGSAAALIFGGAIITVLSFSCRHVFKDRWPN